MGRGFAIVVMMVGCGSPGAQSAGDAAAADAAPADAATPHRVKQIFAFQAPSPTKPAPCNQGAPLTPIAMTLVPPAWTASTAMLARGWVTATVDGVSYAFRNTGTAGTSSTTAPAFCSATQCTTDDASGIEWTNMGSMTDVRTDGKGQAYGTYLMCRDDFSNYVLPHLDGVAEQLSWSAVDQGTEKTGPTFPDWTQWDGVIDLEREDPNWPAGGQIAVLAAAISFGRSGPNKFTPAYVFSQDYADLSAPDWAATGMFDSGGYLIDQAIRPSDLPSHYFHELVPVCQPGATRPTWMTGSGAITDDGSCQWIDDGPHAHPQDTTTGSWAGLEDTLAKWPPGVYNIASKPPSGAPPLATVDLASGFPVTWETPYLVAQRQFALAAVTHLDAKYPSDVAYIRFGAGDGDEANVFNFTQFEQLGLSYSELRAVWTSYVATMYGYWSTLPSSIPVIASVASGPNATTTGESPDWADDEAAALANTLKVVGNQGVTGADMATWAGQPSPGSPWTTGKACAGDWCNILFSYGSVFTRFTFQTVGPTDPTNTQMPGVLPVGTLPEVLSFVDHQASAQDRVVFEMFCQGEDGFATYDPSYSTYAAAQGQGYAAA
ncbi:MAG TPA: hypothetical protein VMJ10_15825, partial [Kofleriaceae bacterium]|nr:hypothetical protein [Kofleriaceae bacterium]